MTLKEEQRRFDDLKWFDSIKAGEDKCGSYEFCAVCNKSLTYPCARAARRVARGVFRIATIIIKRGGKNE